MYKFALTTDSMGYQCRSVGWAALRLFHPDDYQGKEALEQQGCANADLGAVETD